MARSAPVLLFLLLLAACGDNAETTAAPATSTTAATTAAPTTEAATTAVATTATTVATTTTTTAPPSAAEDLEAFFDAAAALDAAISAAASVFNGSYDPEAGTVGRDALDAIAALDAREVGLLIPPGLDVELETAALAVYADLDSRIAALDGGVRYLNQDEFSDADFTTLCLSLGSDSNARYDGDVATAMELAVAAPRPTAAAASEAAGILAVRLETIHSMNWGCDGCGGVTLTDPIPVDWAGATVMDGVGFEASFADGAWNVLIFAC